MLFHLAAFDSLCVSAQVYNTMLRQPTRGKFLADLFENFKAKNNFFSTTIHVLVSATVKLARTMKLPSGLKLYRGIGKELPETFYKEDQFGRKGYMEWGFMSTTSDESIARQVLFIFWFSLLCVILLLYRSTQVQLTASKLEWSCASRQHPSTEAPAFATSVSTHKKWSICTCLVPLWSPRVCEG
jgi:hypothetical protein